MTIGERINDLLERRGESARGVSIKLFGTPDRLRHLIAGRVRSPRSEALTELANHFDVSERWLLHGDDADEDAVPDSSNSTVALVKPRPIVDKLPVLGSAAASESGMFQIDSAVIDWVDCPPRLKNAQDVYALYVSGDSMSPRYKPGELIFVHPHRPVISGDDVIVQRVDSINGDVEAWLKTYVKTENGNTHLYQLNPPDDIIRPAGEKVKIHKVLGINDLFGV